MAAVLIAVVGSQIAPVVSEIDRLTPVLPVYIAFAFLAPMISALVAMAFKLPMGASRAVTFSASACNSLVVVLSLDQVGLEVARDLYREIGTQHLQIYLNEQMQGIQQ